MKARTKDGKSVRFHDFSRKEFPHGTYARYVQKCRCPACRLANRMQKAERTARVREQAASATVKPNGPPGLRTVTQRDRWGTVRTFKRRTCPGTAGKPCIRGAAWLKDKDAQKAGVCLACIERATEWNGLVSSREARKHLLKLRDQGIGYKTVALACDYAASALHDIIMGRARRIRAKTAKKILAVDEGARADRSPVDSDKTIQNIAWLREEGFSMRELARLLGYTSGTGVYTLLKCARRSGVVRASTDLKISRFCNRVEAGQIAPGPSFKVPAGDTRKLLRRLMREGFTRDQLVQRLGICFQLDSRKVKRSTAEKVKAFHDEVMAGDKPEKLREVDRAVLEIARHLEPDFETTEDRELRLSRQSKAAQERRLIDAYSEGVSLADLEERFGIEQRTILRIAQKAGVTPRREESKEATA